jgi:RNA polymerase sigma-70 factor, ECF subfamily
VENMPGQEASDEAQAHLLRRVAAGDLEAMATFYDETAGALFTVAFRILGDHSEAEEVIQDVFLQIWDKAGTFDSVLGSAFHWVVSIARHRAIDRLRARQRRAKLIEQVNLMRDTSMASNSEPPGLQSEELIEIHAALKNLPNEQRLAIQMAFFEGKTHHEIAAALHEPLGTIKARIRRGMLKLRDSLQAYA